MKNFIRIMMTVMLTAVISLNAAAQDQKKQRMTREQLAEVQARRIANDMAFDDATSRKFIDTYTSCQKEIWALGPRMGRKGPKNNQPMTDEETEKAIKQRFEHSQKMLDIREKYYGEYSKFLTPKQIQRVYQLEKQMMNRLAKNRGKRPGGRMHR